ncbi:hypothetical protein K0U83_00840 [bacterium]|nr:hypothetical protein [bacterium]
MKYDLSAEKLEVSLEIDDSFIEALLGAVRAGAASMKGKTVLYKGLPKESDAEKEAVKEEAEPAATVFEFDRSSAAYVEWYWFVATWLQNFDLEGIQPDRTDLTRKLGSMRHAGKILKFLGACGGLTQGVYDAVCELSKRKESARLSEMDDTALRSISRHVAENITQVSSIFFSDLSNLLEYHNPLED